MNQYNNLQNNNNMNQNDDRQNKYEFKNFNNKKKHKNLEYEFKDDNQNNIFISNSSLDGFAFLFDNLKNFYYNEGTDYKPIFTIFYDNNRESLYGTETINSQNNQYQLSGKREFNIKNFEVYNLKISRIKN